MALRIDRVERTRSNKSWAGQGIIIAWAWGMDMNIDTDQLTLKPAKNEFKLSELTTQVSQVKRK